MDFRPKGMPAFLVVWFGQLVSLMGSAMSGFALTIYAYQKTESATALAIVGLCNFAPMVIFSPIAGALVDRWNRKLVMMLSDLAAGLMTVVILLLASVGNLEIWHLCVTGFISGTFQSFQWPAYSAAITLMVPKKHYARASGLMSLPEWGSGILAPILAGALLATIGLANILLIDVVTFVFAILVLLWVVVPNPERTTSDEESRGGLLKESIYGFKYIWKRPGLLGLQLVFAFGNFLASLGGVLIAPMILARTGMNTVTLGAVESVAGLGGLIGSLVITAWGGSQKKIHGVFLGWGIAGISSLIIGLSGRPELWAAGLFIGAFIGPIINSSNQAIWMSKVEPDVQGKVFSVRRMIAQISGPLGLAIGGPLADLVMEPAMRNAQSGLGQAFGGLLGIGAGSGMALIIAAAGLLTIAASVVPYFIPHVRDVETLIPDHAAAQQR